MAGSTARHAREVRSTGAREYVESHSFQAGWALRQFTAWIEFGRLTESGEPQYLTLGSGLSAVAARTDVDSWFFLAEGRRLGLDLWLTSPQRVVLTKEHSLSRPVPLQSSRLCVLVLRFVRG
jgi:hypothetical protein